MSQELLSRSQVASKVGQDIVKLLVEEPVKEAVRDALHEERARLATMEGQRHDEQGADSSPMEEESGGGRVPVKSLLLVVTVVVGVLLAKRIRDSRSADEISGETAQGDTGTL